MPVNSLEISLRLALFYFI